MRDARPPLCVQILSISCSFWENLAKLRVHAPPLEGSRPPLGEILDPSLRDSNFRFSLIPNTCDFCSNVSTSKLTQIDFSLFFLRTLHNIFKRKWLYFVHVAANNKKSPSNLIEQQSFSIMLFTPISGFQIHYSHTMRYRWTIIELLELNPNCIGGL